jgi:multiple sugar transport system substrate-binding protein
MEFRFGHSKLPIFRHLKTLFSIVILLLLIGSVFTYFNLPKNKGDRPILTWMNRPDPIRKKQIETFHRWMEKNDYPPVELKMDVMGTAYKDIVQGVSGVAGDILECYAGFVNSYRSVGILEDVTEVAKEMGFSISETYPAVKPAIVFDGKQYGFPRNVGVRFLWVNLEAFERAGLSAPPDSWTFEEFERMGTRYVDALNDPDKPRSVFFHRELTIFIRTILLRSEGVDIYNETMTASHLNRSASEEVYERVYRWINELRLIPTLAESKTLSAESGTSRVMMHLFANGNYGMIDGGRWGLMHFRNVGPYKLAVAELPYGHYRNSLVAHGTSVVYKGSKNKELAYYFLKFLASEEYNMQIVENADGLPPVPKYTETEEFLRPPDYPNEWGIHGRIKEMSDELATAFSYGAFTLFTPVIRHEKNAFDKMMSNRSSVKEALGTLTGAINADMVRKVSETPELSERYANALKDQAEIERLRKEGEMVPLHLITNPFYRRYYLDQGWSLPEGSSDVVVQK